ncbi:MAG: hypothetical protein JJT81_07310 [Rubellimicrobium sp.]|nr:hypothetical protein [Rubellimicrobium sp.]
MIGVAYAYREAILAFVAGLVVATPMPAGPAASPPPASSGTTLLSGTVP